MQEPISDSSGAINMKMRVFMFKPNEWNVDEEIELPEWVDHAEISAGSLWVYALKQKL
jgi:hypothetical protein